MPFQKVLSYNQHYDVMSLRCLCFVTKFSRHSVYTVPQCDKFCSVGAVARSVKITNDNASDCSTSQTSTTPDSFLMSCCNMDGPSEWHQGLKVLFKVNKTSTHVHVRCVSTHLHPSFNHKLRHNNSNHTFIG